MSSNMFCLEAHAALKIAYEGDFLSLCTVIFWQKVDFLISNMRLNQQHLVLSTLVNAP